MAVICVFDRIAIPEKAKQKRAISELHTRKVKTYSELVNKVILTKTDMKNNAKSFTLSPLSVVAVGAFGTDIANMISSKTLSF